jgi:RND superfamily putative drug exporter
MRFYIVLDSFPQSDEAIKSVNGIRQAINASLTQNGLNIEEFALGGTSAEIADINSVLDSDFNIIMIVVIAAVFVVLVLLLRSLVAPVYLLLTVLLSYVSTLGITSWLFQSILGHDGISFLVPIIVFALLVALGSDYNIFLMSRVREESAAHPPHIAARLAVMATGGVITACGIILAGTFSVLALTPIRTAVHIGVAVSIGILLDTFLVRALLVPAIASLLGKWNWWPRHTPQK